MDDDRAYEPDADDLDALIAELIALGNLPGLLAELERLAPPELLEADLEALRRELEDA